MNRRCSCGKAVAPGAVKTHYTRGGVMEAGTTTTYACRCGETFLVTSSGRVLGFLLLGLVNLALAVWVYVVWITTEGSSEALVVAALAAAAVGSVLVGSSLMRSKVAREHPVVTDAPPDAR